MNGKLKAVIGCTVVLAIVLVIVLCVVLIKDDYVPPSCGVTYYKPSLMADSSNQPTPLIINGQTAVAHSFPWAISLRLSINGVLSEHFCGGTIVSDEWIITAGHCVEQFMPIYTSLRVVVGLHERTKFKDSQIYSAIKVSTIFNSSAPSFIDDIALIKVDRKIKFSKTVGYACLPEYSEQNSFINKTLATVGWGYYKYDYVNSPSQYLQQIGRLVVDDLPICSELGFYDKRSIYCTLSVSSSPFQSACSGDSGGPLLAYNQKEGKWYLEGITSYVGASVNDMGLTRCELEYPNYFTISRYFRKYIDNIMKS